MKVQSYYMDRITLVFPESKLTVAKVLINHTYSTYVIN